MCLSIQKIYKESGLNRIMKATRLQQIANRVDRLRKLMEGDSKPLPMQRQAKNVLGITRLRRA
jgi:hypothetical protein